MNEIETTSPMADNNKDGLLVTRETHLSNMDICQCNDEIVKVAIADNIILTINEACTIVDAVNVFTNRIPGLLLIVLGKYNSFDQQFLPYLTAGGALQFQALAIVICDAQTRKVVSTYFANFNPVKPVLFFEKEQEAKIWLMTWSKASAPSSFDPNVVSEITEQGITITEEIHQPKFALYKRSDGIVVYLSSDNAWFTVKDINESVAAMKEITGGIPHLVLAISGKHSSLDNETRVYCATDEAMQYTKATALVIKNWTQRIIGDLILNVDKPAKPFMLFDNTKEAITWLRRPR